MGAVDVWAQQPNDLFRAQPWLATGAVSGGRGAEGVQARGLVRITGRHPAPKIEARIARNSHAVASGSTM